MKAQGCTVVIIAHGPSLLQVADKMLVLRDGKLVVYGPRDKVLAYLQDPQKTQPGPTEASPRPAAPAAKSPQTDKETVV